MIWIIQVLFCLSSSWAWANSKRSRSRGTAASTFVAIFAKMSLLDERFSSYHSFFTVSKDILKSVIPTGIIPLPTDYRSGVFGGFWSVLDMESGRCGPIVIIVQYLVSVKTRVDGTEKPSSIFEHRCRPRWGCRLCLCKLTLTDM